MSNGTRVMTRRPASMLEARRGVLARLKATLDTAAASPGLTSEGGDAVDDLDRATLFTDRDAATMLAMLFSDDQRRVEDAIRRAEAGGYGVCEDCGAKIPVERLKVCPEATRCVDCQRRQDTGIDGRL